MSTLTQSLHWRNKLYEASEPTGVLSPAQISHVADHLLALAANQESPIWRGVESTLDPVTTVISRVGPRRASSGDNRYLEMLDNNPLNAAYPKRAMSHICSMRHSIARGYGDVALVIPLSPVPIGVCPGPDIWVSFSGVWIQEIWDEVEYIRDGVDYAIDIADIIDAGRRHSTPHSVNYGDLAKALYERDDATVNELMSYDNNRFKLLPYNVGFSTPFQKSEVWFEGPALYIPSTPDTILNRIADRLRRDDMVRDDGTLREQVVQALSKINTTRTVG